MNSKLRKALCKIGKHKFDNWLKSNARKGEEFRECLCCKDGVEYRNCKTLKITVYHYTDKDYKRGEPDQIEYTSLDKHGNKFVH